MRFTIEGKKILSNGYADKVIAVALKKLRKTKHKGSLKLMNIQMKSEISKIEMISLYQAHGNPEGEYQPYPSGVLWQH